MGLMLSQYPNGKRCSRLSPTLNPTLSYSMSLGTQDGRNLCKQIKSNPSTQNIAVILFSANHDIAKTIPECLANGFIDKPFDINDLIDNIDYHLAEMNES